jgi:hypothetical protein
MITERVANILILRSHSKFGKNERALSQLETDPPRKIQKVKREKKRLRD